MTRVRGRRLKSQLVLLCGGLFIPTLLFVGVLLWQLAMSERSRAEEQATRLSHAEAVALDREIFGVLTTLQALATSPSLQTGDLAGFYAQAGEIRRLQHIYISLRNVEGRTVLTTRAPFGAPPPTVPALAAADQIVLRTNAPTVTDAFAGAVATTPVFQIIAAPVLVAGRPTYLLGASLDPDYLGSVFRRENLPRGWVGSLSDQHGILVARTVAQDDYIGRPASSDPQFPPAAAGFTYGRSVTGVQSLLGFARSDLTGWTASVDVPANLVSAPLRHSLLLLLGLGTALALLSAAFALLVGKRISDAVLRLREAAGAIGEGRPVGEIATSLAEINQVGQALRDAAAQLEKRSRERDAAEAGLRDSEAHLSGIFAQTGAGFAEAEEDGRIVSANDHYCALTGRDRAALLRMRLADIPHPDDAAFNATLMQGVLDTGEPATAEKRFLRPGGDVIWVANTISPIQSASGKRTLLSVAIDISEQKRVERDLEHARDAAEQANVAKSTFLANMSHELRTPLSAIIGYSEMLREEAGDGADPAEFGVDMGKIESNARHLLRVINDVLDLSKIESGRMEAFAESFDVEATLRDVAATVESLVSRKGNTLALHLCGGLGTMHSDVLKVRQILLNLLSNAAKFTEKGTITLSAELDAALPDKDIVFQVSDSGIGMTPEQIERLFQRFTQADSSTTRRFGGTGLGLSIAKAFVKILDGTVAVASEPGLGTTFTVRLPVTYRGEEPRSRSEIAATPA